MITKIKTLLDVRIASGIPNISARRIKVVKGHHSDESIDYALFVNDEPLGAFDASSDQEALFAGMAKIRSLLAVSDNILQEMKEVLAEEE